MHLSAAAFKYKIIDERNISFDCLGADTRIYPHQILQSGSWNKAGNVVGKLLLAKGPNPRWV